MPVCSSVIHSQVHGRRGRRRAPAPPGNVRQPTLRGSESHIGQASPNGVSGPGSTSTRRVEPPERPYEVLNQRIEMGMGLFAKGGVVAKARLSTKPSVVARTV